MLKVGRVLQPLHAAGAQRGEQQAEPRDGDDVRVQVHAVRPDPAPSARARAGFLRGGVPARAGTAGRIHREKVSRAAGRINHPDDLTAEGLDGRGQRAVEDELLDEDRRLEKRVTFAGELGEVLVEIAEEASVPLRIGEIMHQRAGLGIGLAPEIEQVFRRIARRSDLPERIVFPVEEFLHRRQRANVREDFLEVFALSQRWVLAEEHLVLVLRPLQPAARPGEIRRLDQLIVFQKPNEDASQHPRHGDLGQLLIAPRGISQSGATFLLRRIVLCSQWLDRPLACLIASGPQIILQPLNELLEIREEFLRVDHLKSGSMFVSEPSFINPGILARVCSNHRNWLLVDRRQWILIARGNSTHRP